MANIGNTVFVSFDGSGVYKSADNGANWTAVNTGLSTNKIYTLAVSGTTIFAGGSYAGVYMSTDNGAKWTAVNDGLPAPYTLYPTISNIYVFNGFLYAQSTSVWKRALSEMITTNVTFSEEPSVSSFELYPNPAKNSFKISAEGISQVDIINILGEKVLTTSTTKDESISVSSLTKGFYTVSIKTNNSIVSKSLLIE